MEDGMLDDFLEDTMKGKFLTFSLGEESYGIDIFYVTEIVGIQPVTMVPEFPAYMKGIINLRGRIIPVMDARIKFGKPSIDYNDRTCIVVVDVADLSIGIIVDAVTEVLDIIDENIVPPPVVGGTGSRYIKSVAKHEKSVILIIECEHLLSSEERQQLSLVKNEEDQS